MHLGAISSYDDRTISVENPHTVPTFMDIRINYPNPFNPRTTIEFALNTEGFVKLKIFNITGQKVRTLASEPITAGNHTIRWDGKNNFGQAVSSGVYIARISMGGHVAAKSMLLMK